MFRLTNIWWGLELFYVCAKFMIEQIITIFQTLQKKNEKEWRNKNDFILTHKNNM